VLPAGGLLAPIAGGSPEADVLTGGDVNLLSNTKAAPYAEITFVAVLFSAASIVFGVFPSPLFNLAAHAGRALGLF
jgi:hypothetical protein